ncbi:MAG: glycosyltransferase family 2 protein [Sedimentisphaerales bacterium]|nr:glycosyltransferase family 2 protein [Sedimentisphaerales bacterium]
MMIDILLATYNSSKYLEQTIESILKQEFQNWRLLIRDGGSNDNTLKIIEKYTQNYKGKIIYYSSTGNACAIDNFSALLLQSSSDYIMFCDHDDVWLPNKISKSISIIKKNEDDSGKNVPFMLFTDKYVVNSDLSVISNSYLKYQKLNPERIKLNYLLVQNVPSGCTILINRAFADLCGEIPNQAVMHDHWLALIGATLGKMIYLDEPTLLYRQHAKNYLGASKYGWAYFFSKFTSGIKAARKRFYENVEQSKSFVEHFGNQLNNEDLQLLMEFSSLDNYNWLNRRKILLRHRIFKTGLRRNLGMFLII